jgi:hypothetical protein
MSKKKMGTCRTCHWYLSHATECLKIGKIGRSLEIEQIKKGLQGECSDYLKYQAVQPHSKTI